MGFLFVNGLTLQNQMKTMAFSSDRCAITVLTLLAVLLPIVTASAQNTIKFYRVDLKASEILPNGRKWGPSAGDNRTETFTRATNDLIELLGQTYQTKDLIPTKNFL